MMTRAIRFRFSTLLFAATAMTGVTTPAEAGSLPQGIFLHLAPAGTSSPSTTVPITQATDVVTNGQVRTGTGPNYFAFLLGARGELPNLGGLQCGIDYENGNAGGQGNGIGVDIFSWQRCAQLEFKSPFPAWPAPGSSNLITWNTTTRCQTGDYAVAGYFYLTAHGPDRLSVIRRPSDKAAKLADCGSTEVPLEVGRLGFVQFSAQGNQPGCNPLLSECDEPVAVEASTWSRMKALQAGAP
jgi:hypothetical protein